MADKNSPTIKPLQAVKPAPKPVALKPMAEAHQMSQKPTNLKKS